MNSLYAPVRDLVTAMLMLEMAPSLDPLVRKLVAAYDNGRLCHHVEFLACVNIDGTDTATSRLSDGIYWAIPRSPWSVAHDVVSVHSYMPERSGRTRVPVVQHR